MSAELTCPPFGVVSLGDYMADPRTGALVDEGEKFRALVDMGVICEELGFDSYHLGEHHFTDYAMSAPAPMLSAIAVQTESIILSTAVTLLGHHDPIFVAEDFGVVDVLSRGRMEILVGRGVYKDHYRLFGQDADESEHLLDESVELLRRLWTERDVHWSGSVRPPLTGVTMHPRLVQDHAPIVMSASSMASVSRAVRLGCPIAIATISTGKFLPNELVAAYRQQWLEAGRDPKDAKVILHVHCYCGPGSTSSARDYWMPYQLGYLKWVVNEVRPGAPLNPVWTHLDQPDSQAICGSVDDVAAEIAARIAAIGGVDRFLVQTDSGGIPIGEAIASHERVASSVRSQVGDRLAVLGY